MPFVSFQTKAYKAGLDALTVRPAQIFADPSKAERPRHHFRGPLVRRPYQGIQIKERTPAHITVRKADGEFLLLNNSLGDTLEAGGGHFQQSFDGREQYYTDFSLLEVQESREEKFQMQETFGEDFLFFYGERPRFLSCGGVLVNTADFQWRTIFLENYDKFLRGTRCVENRARVYLSWDDILVEGYIIRCTTTDNAGEPYQVPFSFVMVLTGYFSLGALNLAATQAFKSATVMDSGEVAGSLAAEVAANGHPIDMTPSFWAMQLEAITGSADPQQALQNVIDSPHLLMNVAPHATQMAMHLPAEIGREKAMGLLTKSSYTAPFLQQANGWSSIGIQGVTKWAGREGMSKIFGAQYQKTSSLSPVVR